MLRSIATGISEAAGAACGTVVAPLFLLTSVARRTHRTFHPRGVVIRARVDPIAGSGSSVGRALAGPALVRLSAALFERERRLPDALGCAIRFRETPDVTPEPAPHDQDLLFATIRRPWTLPFAPLTTKTHDHLANTYFGVSPFDAPSVGRCFLRLRCDRLLVDGTTRRARLQNAIARGRARMTLEMRRPFDVFGWVPIARISLVEIVSIDERMLFFSPFRTGRGLVPRGFIHAMRRGAYRASQSARRAIVGLRSSGDGRRRRIGQPA